MTTHATLRAIAYLRHGEDALEMFMPNGGVNACDGTPDGDYVGWDQGLPTCPACLVLWDEALEGRRHDGR